MIAFLNVAVSYGEVAQKTAQRLVDGKTGVRVEHFVARVHQSEEELGNHRLATRLDGHVLGTMPQSVGPADVTGERLTKRPALRTASSSETW